MPGRGRGRERGRVPEVSVEVGSAVQVPWHFRCPISLELMRDPVTVSTGQTYDRASIEAWVGTGHTTCPVTRAPLPDPALLIPNHTLRRLIQDWCVAHRSLGVERIPTPKQPADPALLRLLLVERDLHHRRPHLPRRHRRAVLLRLPRQRPEPPQRRDPRRHLKFDL